MNINKRHFMGAAAALSCAWFGATFAQASVELTEGEIRKIDKENLKITIRHGEIKNMGMPPMTMVFHARDAAMADSVKVGDKVRFAVEKKDGLIAITELKPAD